MNDKVRQSIQIFTFIDLSGDTKNDDARRAIAMIASTDFAIAEAAV